MAQKKIAILTQPLKANYGGILQNYALSEFLKKHGYKVKTINRVEKNPNSKLKIIASNLKRYLISYLIKKNTLNPIKERKIFENQSNFIRNYIDLTTTIDNSIALKNHFKKENYDIVIIGSDQVWRPSYSPNIFNYYLDFLESNTNILKLAYASSFGTSEWEYSIDETKKCARLAKKFEAISLREKSGVKLSKQHLGVRAEWVLDPTMLLEREDYLQLASKVNISKRKGVFSYILDENDAISKIINKVKDELGLESFTNQPNCRGTNNFDKKLEDLIYPPVEGWIKAFVQAEFVITNSFHGTIFCLIFNKPFITIVNKERGAARFHSILGEFKLENRLIQENEIDELNKILSTKVDFSYANNRLNELKTHSQEFLINNLNKHS